MKRTISLLISVIMVLGIISSAAYADDGFLPYTCIDDNGVYYNLPDSGSAENGKVILDIDLARIFVLRTEYMTDYPEYRIDLLVENKIDECFFIEGSSYPVVDGYSFEAYCRDSVPAQQFKIVSLYIMAEGFVYACISTPQEIKFNIAFYSGEEFILDNLLDIAMFAIYPSGLQDYEVCYNTLDNLGYSDFDYRNPTADCSFKVLDAKMQENGEFYQIDVVLENSSRDYRTFSWSDVKAEGQPTEPYWSCTVASYSNAISHIYIDVSNLNLKDPGGPTMLEFTLVVDNGADTPFTEEMVYCPARG